MYNAGTVWHARYIHLSESGKVRISMAVYHNHHRRMVTSIQRTRESLHAREARVTRPLQGPSCSPIAEVELSISHATYEVLSY
jgi:hypothetical protein